MPICNLVLHLEWILWSQQTIYTLVMDDRGYGHDSAEQIVSPLARLSRRHSSTLDVRSLTRGHDISIDLFVLQYPPNPQLAIDTPLQASSTPSKMSLKQESQNKVFGGTLTKYSYKSEALGGLEAKFNVFLPKEAEQEKVPVLY